MEWLSEDERYLKDNWTSQTDAQLATALGRSKQAISCRRHLLGLKRRTSHRGPNWTAEDIEYLQDSWGHVSQKTIAQKLGRPEGAIVNMKVRLGLGSFLEAGDYISFNQLRIALGRGGGSGYMTTSWIKNRGFPVKHKKVNNCSFMVVYLADFWKWAEQNRTFIDFSKVEKHSLGKEPAWVEEQRRIDFRRYQLKKTTPWTQAEDEKLLWMLRKHQYSYLDISKELRRSAGAIQRRVLDLGVPERPIKADNTRKWAPEEYREFGELIKQGCDYPVMADILGRSDKALRGRCFDIYHTERLDLIAAAIGDGTWGDNAPPQTMQMIRRAKEREARERAALIARLGDALRIHRNNLGWDGYWQKDMCMRWHPVKGCTAGAENCDVCGSSFQRIPPQYCVRCGGTFFEREKNRVCEPCRTARKKQAQRKFAVLHGGRRPAAALPDNPIMQGGKASG